MNLAKELSKCSATQLRNLAKAANVSGSTRKTVEDKLERLYTERARENYPRMELLGEGADGSVYVCKAGRKRAVIKLFRSSKTFARITKEIELQTKAADAGLSIHLLDSDASAKYIVMPILYTSLYELYKKQGYVMNAKQLKDVKQLLKRYDAVGIFHGDPNPANFMYTKSGKLLLIDFGFAEYITEELCVRYGQTPNQTRMLKGFHAYLERCKR